MVQSYAWVTMLVSYSKTDGILQAAKDTFSGERPCELCCKIQEAKGTEPNDSPPALPAFSGKLFQEMVASRQIVVSGPSFRNLPSHGFPAASLSAGWPAGAPPTPPPQSAI